MEAVLYSDKVCSSNGCITIVNTLEMLPPWISGFISRPPAVIASKVAGRYEREYLASGDRSRTGGYTSAWHYCWIKDDKASERTQWALWDSHVGWLGNMGIELWHRQTRIVEAGYNRGSVGQNKLVIFCADNSRARPRFFTFSFANRRVSTMNHWTIIKVIWLNTASYVSLPTNASVRLEYLENG